MDLSKVVEFFETHRKFFVALAAAVTVAVAVVTDDKHLDIADVVAIIGAFGGAGAVQAVSNDSKVEAKAKRVVREAKGE